MPLLFVLFLCFAAAHFTVAAPTENGVWFTSLVDTDLNNTIRAALDSFSQLLRDGLPEFGVPSLEPLWLDDVRFEGSASPGVHVSIAFTGMSLTGVSNMSVEGLDVVQENDTAPRTLELQLRFPLWTVRGDFNATGRTFFDLLPVSGNGTFTMNATDVLLSYWADVAVAFGGQVAIEAPRATDVQVDGDVTFHFDELLGGGWIGGIANRLINLFAGRNLFDAIQLQIVKKMDAALVTAINRKLQAVSIFQG